MIGDIHKYAPPLQFRGKMVSLRSTLITVEPVTWFATNDDDRVVISSLNNHLDSCVVCTVARIAKNGVLAYDNLNDPSNRPWFLLQGEYRGLERYFIVNDREEYLPCIVSPSRGEVSLLNPQAYKEEIQYNDLDGQRKTMIYEWDMFSRLDLGLVREAMTAYGSQF